jgi:hypothetical protein
MGVDTINQLVTITEDEGFKSCLQSQLNEYKQIHSKAKEMLNKNGYDEKGINAFDKIKTYLMINMQTMADKTSSHISEMLIIGSNMGIIDAIKNIKKYKDAEKDILDLMERLQRFEESNIIQLKQFL